MTPVCRLIVAAALALLSALQVRAQTPAVSRHADAPPVDLSDALEGLFATGGQRVVVGGRTCDFWWVKSLPLSAGTRGVSWSDVDEGTLVGAVLLSNGYHDIRGQTIKAGLYTLRLALQPGDGNHLGTAAHREFLLIAPTTVDDSAAAAGHDKAVDMARQSIGASHPGSWAIDPLESNAPPGTIVTADEGQRAVVFEVPISRDGRDLGTIRFGLVLVGSTRP